MILQIFSVIAPILLITALGFYWSSRKLPFDGQFVSQWVMNVSAPCLILYTFLNTAIDLSQVQAMATYTLTALILTLLVSAGILRSFGLSLRSFVNPLSFANTGNMGLPLCLFAFGEQALGLALVWFVVTTLVHFSLGVALAGGNNPLKVLMCSPVFYAALMALLLIMTQWQPPSAVVNTLDLLGSAAIPLMIFALGVSLQQLQLSSFKQSLLLALLRLAIGCSIGLLVIMLFDLDGMIAAVILLQASMPAAVFNYLIALRYERHPQEVAGIVIFSTLLCFMMLPLLLWYIFAIAGF